MPDGSDGFSLVIIVTAEFGSGLQLGFGFTLLGVGGLLGLNRTVNADALLAGSEPAQSTTSCFRRMWCRTRRGSFPICARSSRQETACS